MSAVWVVHKMFNLTMSSFRKENYKLTTVAVESPLGFGITIKDQFALLAVRTGGEIIVDHGVLARGVKTVNTRHACGNIFKWRIVVAVGANGIGFLLAIAH